LLVLAASACGGHTSQSSGSSGPFHAEYVEGLIEPEVNIKNKTELSITVQINGPASKLMTIGPNSDEAIKVPAGTYNFEASAEGARSTSGQTAFQENHRYTWTFIVRRVQR